MQSRITNEHQETRIGWRESALSVVENVHGLVTDLSAAASPDRGEFMGVDEVHSWFNRNLHSDASRAID